MRSFLYGGLNGPDSLWLGGKRPRDDVPARVSLNAQSTRHGARLGPALAPQVSPSGCGRLEIPGEVACSKGATGVPICVRARVRSAPVVPLLFGLRG